ncbi:MAG: hypothetical protein JXA69_00355 [Phycisphaerae bacterium]|nr:hypothetical protein [Phycisphaerae bacterium]
MNVVLGALLTIAAFASAVAAAEPICVSGIYPHLAFYNANPMRETGVGAVVPWANRLWVITYSAHAPHGSTDELYEITPDLKRIVRPESVGGTPANRLIHRESEQLIIGPYFIDTHGAVRVIPPDRMPGRLTATARHLTDPAHKVYMATMEEGVYEVDVHTLDVTTLFPDGHVREPEDRAGPLLPGRHGKGAYTSQGRLVYSNNGESAYNESPWSTTPSGCLAEWNGREWNVVERAQFCEVTGPGGIHGNANETDPLWATGWDRRSVILMLLDVGQWHRFRLPKASHTYDALHGWFTEWPRIRPVGPDRSLMTMHGMLWDFPLTFAASRTKGIRPLSSYLRIIGDFCEWNGRIVFGCDDASVFENPFVHHPHSNLWFVEPAQLTTFGPRSGFGGVWLDEPATADKPSDPYLFAGFDHRVVHLSHAASDAVTFTLETDVAGDGTWRTLETVVVPPTGYAYHVFAASTPGEWIRIRANRNCDRATAWFVYSAKASTRDAALFDGLAAAGQAAPRSFGLIRPRGEIHGALQYAASIVDEQGNIQTAGYYEIGPDMQLRAVNDPESHKELTTKAKIDGAGFEVDDASVIVADADGRRFHLPKSDAVFDTAGPSRCIREVVTERSLMNVHGTFYELPRGKAGGLASVKPVCTHNRLIHDFCSWRGLLVLSGTRLGTGRGVHHIVSDDDRASLWFGSVDDLWQLGKPRGHGGPWQDTAVSADAPSEPYLMRGYDRKVLTIAHDQNAPVTFTVEVDAVGNDAWACYARLTVPPGEKLVHTFPDGYSAAWVRFHADRDCRATAQLVYD